MNKETISELKKIEDDLTFFDMIKENLHRFNQWLLIHRSAVVIYSFILLLWFCVLSLIRGLQLASLSDRSVLGSWLFFISEIMLLSLIFYIWFFNNKNKSTEKIMPIETMQEHPSTMSNNAVKPHDPIGISNIESVNANENFAFLLNTKENTKNQYRRLLHLLSNLFNAGAGIAYTLTEKGYYTPVAGYALPGDIEVDDFEIGEGLNGQAIYNKKPMIISDLPENYIHLESGLGKGKPKCLLCIPIMKGTDAVGLIELQTFTSPTTEQLDSICNKVSEVLEKSNISLTL